jgi:alpha-D-xyloside xylohydrolase
MLGDSLLVAPVFSHDGSVTYYVPEGKWTLFFSGEVIEGPRWVRETHDFLSLPLLVRPNSVIPIGDQAHRPDYDFTDNVTLQMYELEDGHSMKVEIPSLDGKIGTIFEVARQGTDVHIQRRGPEKAWSVSCAGDLATKIDLEANVGETTIHVG